MQKIFIILLGSTSFFGCAAQRTVQFDVPEGVTVSIVDPSRPNATGEIVPRPFNIPAEKLDQKAIRFAGPGKVPQYWIFSSQQAESIRLAPALANAPFRDGPAPQRNDNAQNKDPSSQSDGKANVTHRLLMQSYRALLANDLEVASETATSLEKLNPKLASAKIIKGLVAMQRGDSDAARSELTTAKSLDPEDKEIDTLLEMVK